MLQTPTRTGMLTMSCPSCGRKTRHGEAAHFPFCSARCRDLDLAAWSDGSRVISTPITQADSSTDMSQADMEDDS